MNPITSSEMQIDNKKTRNPDLIIHIGMHKTGITFLQGIIFPQFKTVSLVRGWYSLRKIMTNCNSDKNKILISNEGLSGNPFGDSYEEDFYRNTKTIKILFGNPKIIVGFRQQHPFITSFYKQYLHQGGYKNISYIFNFKNTGLIKKNELKFHDRLSYLKNHFSEVLCYSLEQISDSLPTFIQPLSAFLSIPGKYSEIKLNDKKLNRGVD